MWYYAQFLKKTDDFLALFEGFDETFIQALEARDDLPPQERENL